MGKGSYAFNNLGEPLINEDAAKLSDEKLSFLLDFDVPSFLRSDLKDVGLAEWFRKPARLPFDHLMV